MLNPARMGGEAGENRLLIPSESCGCPPPAPPLAPGPVPRRLRRRGGARFVAAGKDRPLRNGRVGEAEARRSERFLPFKGDGRDPCSCILSLNSIRSPCPFSGCTGIARLPPSPNGANPPP